MNTGQELKADPTINAALEEIYTQADDLRNYAGKLAYEGCLNLLRKPAVADDIEPQQVTRVDTLFAKTKVILAGTPSTYGTLSI